MKQQTGDVSQIKKLKLYSQLDVSPSGLLDSRMTSLSPLRMKISLSQHDTDTMSPQLSRAPTNTWNRKHMFRRKDRIQSSSTHLLPRSQLPLPDFRSLENFKIQDGAA